jgi:hypothetical protein
MQGEGKELFSNPSFAGGAKGWVLREADALPGGGRNGSPSARLKGLDRTTGKWSAVIATLESPPVGRKLRLSLYMKGTAPGQTPMIQGRGFDGSGKQLGSWPSYFYIGPDKWTLAEAGFVLHEETERFTLTVINYTGNDLYVSDAHLAAGEKARPPISSLDGPGVLLASAATRVKPGSPGESGWVTFPIPGTYRSQIPLTFDLKTDPPDALKEFRWIPREDGINWLCEIRVQPPEEGASVRWESYVLVSDFKKKQLPPAEKAEAPEGITKWLRPTACVQSEDPAIRAKAGELAKGAEDLESYVKRVVDFTLRNTGKPGAVFDSLDARKGLECRGSCTSRANLAAALLRSRGIPARTLAHLPAWWNGPLYEHWLIEYWHPGAGWVWAEPSTSQMQPPDWSLVVLNVANPEDEDRSFDPAILHSGVMAGAPYLAVHLHSEELNRDVQGMKARTEDTGNWAMCVMKARGGPEEIQTLFDAAGRAYSSLKKNCMEGELLPERDLAIAAAVEEGDVKKLRQALEPVERWIDKPKEQWPQISMINSIRYTDKDFPVAGCGCLLDTGDEIYAVTAKHVLLYFKSKKMDSVHFKGTLKSWKMFPKNNPKDIVVLDKLVNEDKNELLPDLIPAAQDWLVFTVKERSKNIQPLKFRKEPLHSGERIYIVGWRYTDKNCTQRIYEGKFVRMDKGSFLVSAPVLADNTMPGLSGCPVIDSNGNLIGILVQKAGKLQRPSSIEYPMKILKSRK